MTNDRDKQADNCDSRRETSLGVRVGKKKKKIQKENANGNREGKFYVKRNLKGKLRLKIRQAKFHSEHEDAALRESREINIFKRRAHLIRAGRVAAAFFRHRGKRVEVIPHVITRQIDARVIAVNDSDREHEHQRHGTCREQRTTRHHRGSDGNYR